MSGMLQLMEASFGASSPVHLVTTFDPAKKGSSVTLSSGNTVATTAASAGAVLAVDAATSNCYVDFTITNSTNRGFVGIANTSISYNAAIGADTNGWSYVDTGMKRTNNVDAAYGSSWAAGDVIRATLSNGSLSFKKNGVDQGVAFTGLTGTLYFGWSDNLVGSATIG